MPASPVAAGHPVDSGISQLCVIARHRPGHRHRTRVADSARCPEWAYLIELHSVARVVMLFHGPAANGAAAAVCADCRRNGMGVARHHPTRDSDRTATS